MIYVIGDSDVKQNMFLIDKANELSQLIDKEVNIIFLDSEIKEYQKGYKVEEIILLKSNLFINYDYGLFSDAILKEVKEKADIILFPSNEKYREIASIISYKLDRALLTDAIDLKFEEDRFIGVVPSMDGEELSEYEFISNKPYLATIKAVSIKEKIEKSEIYSIRIIDVDDEEYTLKIKEKNTKEDSIVDIKNAEIIFSGGRGLLGEENFNELRRLAKYFNASVAGSRPIVDLGYISTSEQVGQTGSFVKPKIYVAFGISGAIQHLVGMNQSENIIVVNNNINSNIFKYANYSIVADGNSIIRNALNILEKES